MMSARSTSDVRSVVAKWCALTVSFVRMNTLAHALIFYFKQTYVSIFI